MPLRILMAEDSEIFAQALGQLISSEPDLELLEIARDGQRAVELCQRLRPDLVVMDIQMPRMDGLLATEHIMATCPTPILVVTSDPYRGGIDQSFRALKAGALDLIAKPDMASELDVPSQHEFLQKIRLLADIPVIRHMRGSRITQRAKPAPVEPAERPQVPLILGVVASTGGPKILARLFEELPPSSQLSILIVQHITQGFSAHLAKWLNNHSRWTILEAVHGQPLLPGHAYLAPAHQHLELGPRQMIQLHDEAPINGHRPNGDLLLESLAQHAPSRAMGLILSGMGDDGARGLCALKRAGGHTFAQDVESCVVSGMPRAALMLGAVDEILTPEEMAEVISWRAAGARTR